MVFEFCKDFFGADTQLAFRVKQHYQKFIAQLDEAYQIVAKNLIAKYEKLGKLAEAAFDSSLNLELMLQASIQLAQAYSVPNSNIIDNVDELDSFILS